MEKIFAYIAALCLYANIPPYVVWHNDYVHWLSILFAIICIFNLIIKGSKGIVIITGFLFVVLYLAYCLRLDVNFNGFLRNFSIVFMFFLKKEFVLKILDAFKNIFALLLFLGLCTYLIVQFTPLNLPYIVIEPLNILKNHNYLQYPFCVFEDTLISFRFCAQFDEPGVVGTLCGILLFADNFNLKKKTNFILLISGIFSVSLFFYGLALLYIFIYLPIKYKILVSLVILFVSVLLYNNEIIYNLVFRRFLIEDGEWTGNNRTIYEFDKFYDNFRFSFEYFVGTSNKYFLNLNEGGSSYKQLIVRHGVIFFALYILTYFVVAKKFFRKNIFLYMQFGIILLGTLYQRPVLSNYAYVFLLYSSIFYISAKSKQINLC